MHWVFVANNYNIKVNAIPQRNQIFYTNNEVHEHYGKILDVKIAKHLKPTGREINILQTKSLSIINRRVAGSQLLRELK